jgi:hypothetical protein
MSALDFTARALALRAIAHDPLTFAEAAQARLPAALSRFESSGHSVRGLGAATYLADDFATAQLRDAHPEAVIAGAGSSFFRLAGDGNGYVRPEQLGCPASAAGTDQLPWLQKAIDYVEAMPDLNGVLLTQREYELWRTAWSGNPMTDYATTASNSVGNFLKVTKPIRIVSTHPLGSVVRFKGPNGGSLLTDYDVIDGTFFGDGVLLRGHGFVLWSEVGVFDPQAAREDLPALYLENIAFVTGMVADKDTAWPASVANPNCWDISNKFIAARNDHQHGRVELRNCEIDGFFGEVLYLGGVTGVDDTHLSSELVIRDCRIANTNGQAMNPNGVALLDVDGLLVEDCTAVWEGSAGWKFGRVANCIFRNCLSANAAGGAFTNFRRKADDSQAFLVLSNVTAQNCGYFHLGSNVKATGLHLIDTGLRVIGVGAASEVKNIDVDCVIECDTMSMSGPVSVYPDGAAAAQSIENVHVRARLRRSDYAVDNVAYMNGLVALGFGNVSFGPNCVIRLRGDHLGVMPNLLGSAPTFTAYRPKIIDEGLFGTGDPGSGASAAFPYDPVAVAAPEFGYRWLRAVFNGAGLTAQYPVNVPALANFLDGHEVTIEHSDAGNPAATLLVDSRVVIGYGDRITLKANTRANRWDVVEGDNVILGPFEVGDEATGITVGAGKKTFFMPRRAFTLRQIDAELITAQAGNGGGGIFTVDLNEKGASVLSTKITVDNGETTSRTAATRQVLSDRAIAAGAKMTVDVDQVGDGSAAGLRLYLIGKWTE